MLSAASSSQISGSREAASAQRDPQPAEGASSSAPCVTACRLPANTDGKLTTAGVAVRDQPVADPVQGLEIELLGRLDGDEAHGGPLHGLGDRLRI
jgi:hypothetical protein